VVCGCRKFQVDELGDHLCTCTSHSGVKKSHDWTVDQLPDLFHKTHKVKTQQVVQSWGQHCDDIELGGYLSNVDPPGHLRYPNNLDQSLNDTSSDKIRRYRTDYSNNPSRGVGFMFTITSTSGRLHSEFIRILFLQTHRQTDRFFTDSGVLSAQSHRGFFHYLRTVFSSMCKSRVGNILVKVAGSRINLNIDGESITSKSHTHPSHSQTSCLLTSSLFLGVPVPRPTQCLRGV
jgi:hypothetical protein